MAINSNFKIWTFYFFLASAVGAIIETTAYLLQWWIMNPPWFFIPWIFLWEGLCFGTLAFLTRKIHPLAQYGVSAAVGGIGEVIVAWVYPLWVFPGESFLFLHGLLVIVIVFTLIWGVVCPGLTVVIKKLTTSD